MCNNHRPAEQAAAAPAIEGVTFDVNEMTCDHCAGSIRKSLEHALPGSAVAIDVAGRRVTVAGDVTVAEKAIRDAGYEPKLVTH